MKTMIIQIGNSDDKLKQKEWSNFVHDTALAIGNYAHMTHFFGGSMITAPWQNAAWIIECDTGKADLLIERLRDLASKYKQDSIAVTLGETQFVGEK